MRDSDLVAALRAELASIDPSRACDRVAESAGLGPAPRTGEPAIARLAFRLGHRAGESSRFDWPAAPEHCLLELEAHQVARAVRGDLNRMLNAESANLQRAVAAAGRQLVAIDELEADGRLRQQPNVVRLVAAARRETPESTLSELAERLALHRSTVQRALDRIESLAFHA